MARVLVVDDAPEVRMAVRRMLERQGHAAAEAESGGTAMTALAAGGYDLVVCDIWMPGIDGIALLKEAGRRWPDLPFLVISGGGARVPLAQSAALAETYGAGAVLYKPFEPEALRDAVDALLGR